MNKLFSMWMQSWFQRHSPELFCRFQFGQIPGIFRGKDLSDFSLVLEQTILSYVKSKNSHSSLFGEPKTCKLAALPQVLSSHLVACSLELFPITVCQGVTALACPYPNLWIRYSAQHIPGPSSSFLRCNLRHIFDFVEDIVQHICKANLQRANFTAVAKVPCTLVRTRFRGRRYWLLSFKSFSWKEFNRSLPYKKTNIKWIRLFKVEDTSYFFAVNCLIRGTPRTVPAALGDSVQGNTIAVHT